MARQQACWTIPDLFGFSRDGDGLCLPLLDSQIAHRERHQTLSPGVRSLLLVVGLEEAMLSRC
jgi:hypothetical protein